MKARGQGLYTLAGATVLLATGCDSPTGTTLGCTSQDRVLEVGTAVNGSLTTDDTQLADGTFADFYSLRLEDTRTIAILMSSATLDSFLYLLDENEEPIELNNDGAAILDARITRSLSRGCYLVVASSFEPQTGSYTLSASEESGASTD